MGDPRKVDRLENKTPPLGSRVKLSDGREGKVVAGCYKKGQGGWRILVVFAGGTAEVVGLKQIVEREYDENTGHRG